MLLKMLFKIDMSKMTEVYGSKFQQKTVRFSALAQAQLFNTTSNQDFLY